MPHLRIPGRWPLPYSARKHAFPCHLHVCFSRILVLADSPEVLNAEMLRRQSEMYRAFLHDREKASKLRESATYPIPWFLLLFSVCNCYGVYSRLTKTPFVDRKGRVEDSPLPLYCPCVGGHAVVFASPCAGATTLDILASVRTSTSVRHGWCCVVTEDGRRSLKNTPPRCVCLPTK